MEWRAWLCGSSDFFSECHEKVPQNLTISLFNNFKRQPGTPSDSHKKKIKDFIFFFAGSYAKLSDFLSSTTFFTLDSRSDVDFTSFFTARNRQIFSTLGLLHWFVYFEKRGNVFLRSEILRFHEGYLELLSSDHVFSRGIWLRSSLYLVFSRSKTSVFTEVRQKNTSNKRRDWHDSLPLFQEFKKNLIHFVVALPLFEIFKTFHNPCRTTEEYRFRESFRAGCLTTEN